MSSLGFEQDPIVYGEDVMRFGRKETAKFGLSVRSLSGVFPCDFARDVTVEVRGERRGSVNSSVGPFCVQNERNNDK